MNIFRCHGLKRETKYKYIAILPFSLPHLQSDIANDNFQNVLQSKEDTVFRAVKFKEILQIKIIKTLKFEVCITRDRKRNV